MLLLAAFSFQAQADWFIKTFRNGSPVATLAQADTLIANTSPIATGTVQLADLLGYSTGEGTGHFLMNFPVPGIPQNQPTDDYAVQGTVDFVVQQAGSYTFGLHTDDGARLRIDGTTIITDDAIHPPRDSTYVSTALTAGHHAVEWVWFNRGGGAEAEVLVAAGIHGGFDSDFTPLSGSGSPSQTKVIIP